MVKFTYTRISKPFDKTFLKFKNCPLLTVGIASQAGQMVKVNCYIDTGAQFCMLDKSYAPYLGISDYKNIKTTEDLMPICGVGGVHEQNRAYFHDLRLIIPKDQKHFEAKNAFQIIETKIGFLENPIAVAGILGVYGFLDHFSFTANIPHGYFGLEPIFNGYSPLNIKKNTEFQQQKLS